MDCDDDDVPVPSQFWITDTPCSSAIREPIQVVSGTDGHPVHNTRKSTCSGPATSGSTAGPPDLMFTQAPTLDESYGPADQPFYDYATDVEPAVDPTLDKGLESAPRAGLLDTGCLLSPVLDLTAGTQLLELPGSESNREQKVHKWLSPADPERRRTPPLGFDPDCRPALRRRSRFGRGPSTAQDLRREDLRLAVRPHERHRLPTRRAYRSRFAPTSP